MSAVEEPVHVPFSLVGIRMLVAMILAVGEVVKAENRRLEQRIEALEKERCA